MWTSYAFLTIKMPLELNDLGCVYPIINLDLEKCFHWQADRQMRVNLLENHESNEPILREAGHTQTDWDDIGYYVKVACSWAGDTKCSRILFT